MGWDKNHLNQIITAIDLEVLKFDDFLTYIFFLDEIQLNDQNSSDYGVFRFVVVGRINCGVPCNGENLSMMKVVMGNSQQKEINN